MKALLNVRCGHGWSLAKIVSLPDTNLHVGLEITLDTGAGGIDVTCTVVTERGIKEGAQVAEWDAVITFVGPGGRVVAGGKNFVDYDELFDALRSNGWRSLGEVSAQIS